MCDDMPTINFSGGIAGGEYVPVGNLELMSSCRVSVIVWAWLIALSATKHAKRNPVLRIVEYYPANVCISNSSPDRAVNN